MKKLLEKMLAFLAKRVLNKYQPKVIGITGSIGKTSTKEAIYFVLKNKYRVRTNVKNYNNELGVPITILGGESGGRSFLKWGKVLWNGLMSWLFTDVLYPEILILEMGADHPGDIKYLTTLAPCDIGVLTHVAPVHLEFMKSLAGVYNEKKNIATHLSKNGWAIFNADEDWADKLKSETKAKTLTYGFSEQADLRLYQLNEGNSLVEGVKGKVLYQNTMIPFHFPHLIAPFSLYSVLAAIAVGLVHNINIIESINSLKEYRLPKGRLQLLEGKNGSLLIDDSYNASPVAVEKAVELLNDFSNAEYRKIFVLGDMLELGDEKEMYHLRVAKRLAESDIAVVITVGQLSTVIYDYLKKQGKKEVYHFTHSKYAAEFLADYISPGDLYFVKGSQGVRMERISKFILAEHLDPKALLPRQTDEWVK
ncbi:MAG TPA: Mur ligase family protein [bacterium]|nr:Mur ligase family protein [bacterium]